MLKLIFMQSIPSCKYTCEENCHLTYFLIMSTDLKLWDTDTIMLYCNSFLHNLGLTAFINVQVFVKHHGLP